MNADNAAPDPTPQVGEARFPVVAIGASAGGLEACRRLLAALPAEPTMAFLLVMHLDPTHDSMLASLLAADTSLTVREAADGMALSPGLLCVIPPGVSMAVHEGVVRLSAPQARHGARLPFDFLLESLAADMGARAVCIVLSGAGGDGSAGLRAVSAAGGLVIAQDPSEAGFASMPESAIATGLVDRILTTAQMPAALADHAARLADGPADGARPPEEGATRDGAMDGTGDSPGALAPSPAFDAILALVGAHAAQEVGLYKTGTIHRRVARRMALAGVPPTEPERYLAMLERDQVERDKLVSDLLIHVTGFFRDPKVFERLAEVAIPELLAALPPDRPLRVWVAGCSTGEEAYTIAMLCRERIEAAGSTARLQILASDLDPEAIAAAREGVYPAAISSAVSAERLERHFLRDGLGWRVSPALRDCVVFTVQDLLSDPPFSRIDLVSCRNVLIYLGAEAQRRVIGQFSFALRPGGLLLLGAAETPGQTEGRFEPMDKAAHIWRRVGAARPGDLHVSSILRAAAGAPPAVVQRRTLLAETCRRLVLETHAPAAALLSRRLECLYLLGPTDRYLRVPSGYPSADFIAMAPLALRLRLRAAASACGPENPVVVVRGGRTAEGAAYAVELRAVSAGGEDMLLACFLDAPQSAGARPEDAAPAEGAGSAAQEAEIEALRRELREAVRDLEAATEAHAADAAEALSVNEEFQSTNEELLASKEELQSLNEELTALNAQLQETLERHRTTAADLRNVLYSTEVATIFLDADLRIRFFTPAARALFRVIATDVGRPLSDLAALFSDDALESDARAVLAGAGAQGREVMSESGSWHMRCVQPYRTEDGRTEGVVITFVDITERREASAALEAARRVAERADAAKSRFLAAASHDLRQPLQSLTLIHGLLARPGADRVRLGALLDRTLGSMTGMLDTLLDVNRIEAGELRPYVTTIPVGPLLARLADEFAALAAERGLRLRLRPCPLSVRSDGRLLERMLRNLLSNSMKYTRKGGVLLGWRRRSGRLRIEVWDTGVGIPPDETEAIFDAYHQVAPTATQGQGQGLGLGLSIVRSLGEKLEHGVGVRSRPGRGSVFWIDAALAQADHSGAAEPEALAAIGDRPLGTILLVEDDPDLCELLADMLAAEGHEVVVASDAAEARRLAMNTATPPDLLLTDYDLRSGTSGLDLAAAIGVARGAPLPTIILSGDITTSALAAIAASSCLRLAKPATAETLVSAVAALLRRARTLAQSEASDPPDAAGRPMIHVVDDDPAVRAAARPLFEAEGWRVRGHDSAEAFLAAPRPVGDACLVVDMRLPGMDGLGLLSALAAEGSRTPAIVITGHGDAATAIAAMRAGAVDFIEKPTPGPELVASVARAMERARDARAREAWRAEAAARFESLTAREREVLALVLAGAPNKNIAADLRISQRTVENHRAAAMRKTGAATLPELVRLALAADRTD